MLKFLDKGFKNNALSLHSFLQLLQTYLQKEQIWLGTVKRGGGGGGGGGGIC